MSWYEVVDSKEALLQGDFLSECPVVRPPCPVPVEIPSEVQVEIVTYNVVVMSQSCDLIERKLDLVLVCPVWPLEDFGTREPFFAGAEGKEALRRGNVTGYHLLNRCDVQGFRTDYSVVDFRTVYGVPFDSLVDLAARRGPRLRLCPPYREHLSQAFARFFMRVGLPADIPPFKK